MRLFIVRHGLAGEHGDPRYPNDDLRPLTAAGRKQFRAAVSKLVKRGFCPVVVATSPLVRCRQTADIVAEIVPDCAAPVELEALAPGSDLAALLAWTEQQQAERVAWVGHSPDVDRLAGSLVGRENANFRFAKGAIAALDFEEGEPLSPGQAELRWFVSPKLLGC